MKSLRESLTMAINENELKPVEIDNIINNYLKDKGFDLVWNTDEVFRYTKATNSAIRKADVIEHWSDGLDSATNTPEEIKEILDDSFAILTVHPEWTLKDFVAYHESGVRMGDPFKYNESQYEWLLNKILKKYPNK